MTFVSVTENLTYFTTESSNETSQKISNFQNYPAGWNYGEGDRFGGAEVERALYIQRLFVQNGFPATDAFPGLAGQIVVTAYKDEYFLQFVVEPQKLATFTAQKGNQLLKRLYHVRQADAISSFVEVLRDVWSISDSSTSKSTTTPGSTRSTLLRLNTPQATEYPSFAAVA
jgi:hypothetical protein